MFKPQTGRKKVGSAAQLQNSGFVFLLFPSLQSQVLKKQSLIFSPLNDDTMFSKIHLQNRTQTDVLLWYINIMMKKTSMESVKQCGAKYSHRLIVTDATKNN